MVMIFNIGDMWVNWFTPDKVTLILRVILILIIGLPLVRLVRSITKRMVKDKLSAQGELLVLRSVYYLSLLILFVTVLNEFGFKLSAILGAAGIFGIALGFASQTSISNIISGIFLISEKPFVFGDTIQLGTSIGVVESIDLLSIKLRTADNRFIRVPNETMIKSEVINLTKYPIRRLEIPVIITKAQDIDKVQALLITYAEREEHALDEPQPAVVIENLSEIGIKLYLYVWVAKENIILLKTKLMLSIIQGFEQEHIEVPYPHPAYWAKGTE